MINCLESSPIKNDFYKPPKTPEVKQEVTELVTTPE